RGIARWNDQRNDRRSPRPPPRWSTVGLDDTPWSMAQRLAGAPLARGRALCGHPESRRMTTEVRIGGGGWQTLLVSEGPSPVFGVADRFVRRWAELEPSQGLIYGLAGTPGRLSDWSPQGRARVADALRHGLAELDRTPPRDGADRRAAVVMRDRLQVWLASATAQDWARELDAGFLSPPAMDPMALGTAPVARAREAGL